MELEKHKTEYASSNILRKKIMNTVYCEEEPVGLPVIKPGDCKKSFEMQRENWSAELHTKPKSPVEPASGRLTFSFVPSTGILPTEVQFGKDSNIAPKVVKSMNSWTGEGMALKQPGGVSENVSLKNILVEDEITSVGGKTNSKQTCPGMNTCSNNVKDLQQTDLFIAEFVIVVDSEEEDDLVNMSNESLPFKGKVHESSGAQVSSTEEPAANVSSVNVNEIFVPEAQPDELSHDMDCQEKELQPYKIKSSYKAFAAIPTNTLLLDQKAVDEPEKNALEETMETHSEVYSPALLRQQTEEICAAIDQVLHDPLPLHSESTSKSSKKKLLPKTIKIAKSPSKSAGRETKYASVQLPMANSCSSSKSTKPGVIRPLSLKINIPEKDEENYFPNPFKQFTLASSRRDIDYERS
ncbi:muscular LMNA-interacting protein isoform 5-T5 [Discoglossus pictus]